MVTVGTSVTGMSRTAPQWAQTYLPSCSRIVGSPSFHALNRKVASKPVGGSSSARRELGRRSPLVTSTVRPVQPNARADATRFGRLSHHRTTTPYSGSGWDRERRRQETDRFEWLSLARAAPTSVR